LFSYLLKIVKDFFTARVNTPSFHMFKVLFISPYNYFDVSTFTKIFYDMLSALLIYKNLSIM